MPDGTRPRLSHLAKPSPTTIVYKTVTVQERFSFRNLKQQYSESTKTSINGLINTLAIFRDAAVRVNLRLRVP